MMMSRMMMPSISVRPMAPQSIQRLTAERMASFVRHFANSSRALTHGLNWEELHSASQLARWSGLCYQPPSLLPAAMEAEQLHLVAHGRDQYTSWIVAEGRLGGAQNLVSGQQLSDPMSAAAIAGKDGPGRPEDSRSKSASGSGWGDGRRHIGSKGQGLLGSDSDASGTSVPGLVEGDQAVGAGPGTGGGSRAGLAVGGNGAGQLPASKPAGQPEDRRAARLLGQLHRVVLIRGVHWSAPETRVMDMSRALASAWPAPFAQDMTNGRGGHLVCHSGISDVALELFSQLAPHLRGLPADLPLVFSGHSLGGSLAKLQWALSLLHGHRRAQLLSCHTFGSPQTLAHNEGGGSSRVMQLLGADPASCRNWVQEHDPIPRAMMLADPYFSAVMQNKAVRTLLEARAWLMGSGSPLSSSRFLFESVEEVFLMKGGCEVLRVRPEDELDLMQMALTEALQRPHMTVQYWLDHHHGSYAHDLHIAALTALRREASEHGLQLQQAARPLID